MNQFFPTLCAEIPHFDSLAGLSIRAVLKPDPQNPNVFQVWLLPDGAAAFTPEMLRQMGVNSLDELTVLAEQFDPVHCSAWRTCHVYKMQHELVTTFAPDLVRPRFYYSPYQSPDGLVVRVVFGSERDMLAFREADVDLEPSE